MPQRSTTAGVAGPRCTECKCER